MVSLKVGDKFLYRYYSDSKSEKIYSILEINHNEFILNKSFGNGPNVPINSILYQELIKAKKSINGRYEFKSLHCDKIEGVVIYLTPLKKKIKKLMEL